MLLPKRFFRIGPSAFGVLLSLLVGYLPAVAQPQSGGAQSLEAKLLAEPAIDLAADAREKGNAVRGAALFFSPQLGCAKCHVAPEGESSIGPALSIWQRSVDDRHLVESVLKPSAKIQKQYQTVQIVTVDGRTLAGVIHQRDGERVVLVTGIGPDASIVVPTDEIEAEKISDVSLMPTGQVNVL